MPEPALRLPLYERAERLGVLDGQSALILARRHSAKPLSAGGRPKRVPQVRLPKLLPVCPDGSQKDGPSRVIEGGSRFL